MVALTPLLLVQVGLSVRVHAMLLNKPFSTYYMMLRMLLILSPFARSVYSKCVKRRRPNSMSGSMISIMLSTRRVKPSRCQTEMLLATKTKQVLLLRHHLLRSTQLGVMSQRVRK